MIQRYAQFRFIRGGSWIVSPSHFVYDFLRKFFLLYSINWPNFIVSLPLFLEILGNMCIAIIIFPIEDFIHFEINLSFLYQSAKLRALARTCLTHHWYAPEHLRTLPIINTHLRAFNLINKCLKLFPAFFYVVTYVLCVCSN